MSAPSARQSAMPQSAAGVNRWLRRNLLFLAGLLISAAAIWQLAKAVEGPELLEYLLGSNLLLAVLCFCSVPFSMLLKIMRQRYLFGERPIPPVSLLYSALYIGYLMNTVLPGRVGEFARAFLIGRQEQVGIPAALSSIVLEKLLDLATLAILLVVLLQVTPLPDWAAPMAFTAAVAVGGGLLGLALMLVLRRQVVGVVISLEKLVPALRRLKLSELASTFLEALAGLGRRRTLPGLLFWSVIVWVSSAVTIWTGLSSVGISAGLSAVVLTLVVTNIGMAVPSAPGYAGVYEGLAVLALLPYGISEAQALAGALVLHATVFGNFIVGGLWFLRRGGHTLAGLRDASGH